MDIRHDVNSQEQATGPLRGVKVLDLTTVIMEPLATQILSDLGANVISIENPSGNTNRSMGAGSHPQLSGVSLDLLRNKRSVVLDLKADAGRDAFLQIVRHCNVRQPLFRHRGPCADAIVPKRLSTLHPCRAM